MLNVVGAAGHIIITGDGVELMDMLCGPSVWESRIYTITDLLRRTHEQLAEEMAPPPVLDMSNIYDRLSAHFWTPDACADRVAVMRAKIAVIQAKLDEAQKKLADARFALDGMSVFARAAE